MRRLPERLRAKVESWTGGVVDAADAVTVVLLRQADEPQVLLLRRRSTMAVGPGMLVFPGGRVDVDDFDPRHEWSGRPVDDFARHLSCSPPLARATVVAAVREVFEETGILLCRDDPHGPPFALEGEQRIHVRSRLEARDIAFSEFLRAHRLSVSADLLAPWGRWISPEFEPIRFDARFLVAILPPGQQVGPPAPEAVDAGWFGISDALRLGTAGDLPMMTPTLETLRELEHVGLDELLAHAWARIAPTAMSRLVTVDGEFWLDTTHVTSSSPVPPPLPPAQAPAPPSSMPQL
jgi:8-oxo-dGTP pyrophosphatase MutT (NUDIX family)